MSIHKNIQDTKTITMINTQSIFVLLLLLVRTAFPHQKKIGLGILTPKPGLLYNIILFPETRAMKTINKKTQIS